MSDRPTKIYLSAQRRQLLKEMRQIKYGRIENLEVCDGEPVLDPPPAVSRTFLFGKENKEDVSGRSNDFNLKKKVKELFEIFDRERRLSIKEIMIDNGLPVRMTVVGANRIGTKSK